MLKQSFKFCKSNTLLSNMLKYKMSTATNEKWDLLSAICIERHPIITPPKSEMEENFQSLLNEIEDENSMKSDHELKVENEIRLNEQLKKGLIEIDSDAVSVDRPGDIEDQGEAELKEFKFAPRVTEADLKNITTSLERKLDKVLLLCVQQKIGKDNFWLPPQGVREEGENMRQAAERILRKTCGENLTVQIYGNAPFGFYKYIYPKAVRGNGSRGAKIFYYLGKYINGNLPDTLEYQWLDRSELKDNLPNPIYKSVSKFLIPEQTA
ncbi:39S ribosomal protein L46, mitochondrial [Microplitis demolitor]|uniref:39S ribosomal protein L46, mitochondrial n=1 Tax=Microplitis demolitor TaxID=69319 RepID=UPI0004CD25DA|nr:39S ribosomal protein L46, mitochondrial [Microplitis demolitor]